MPAPKETLIDRSDMVLVLVDLQERLVAAMQHRERTLAAAGRLARAAALVGAPILVTRQYPQGLGPTESSIEKLLIELADRDARVSGVDKTAFCCAAEAEFNEALSATGRRQVVLAGMETHICIAQTALALAGSGYQVQVAADACCSRDDVAHELALARMRAANVVVTHSDSVMYEAVGRAATDEFKALLEIVKG